MEWLKMKPSYFIKHKVETDIKLSNEIEFQRDEPFIDKVIIKAEEDLDKNYLVFLFLLSNEYDNCTLSSVKEFFAIDKHSLLEEKKIEQIKAASNLEDITEYIKRELALDKTKYIANVFATIIFYERNWSKIPKIKESETNILQQQEVLIPVVTECQFPFLCQMNNFLTQEETTVLQKKFEKITHSQTAYYAMFREIKCSKNLDYALKYILLYSILTELLGNQKKVDDFIESNFSFKRIYEVKINNKIYKATEVSYLRNQFGHASSDTEIDIVKNRIGGLLHNLEGIVMLCIEKSKNEN